jgi:ADP-dependent glucokinase
MIDMFFKTIALQKPDLVVLSGVHLLQFQKDEMRLEKLRVIKRNLLQINRNIPIHLQMGSMADAAFMKQVLHRVMIDFCVFSLIFVVILHLDYSKCRFVGS